MKEKIKKFIMQLKGAAAMKISCSHLAHSLWKVQKRGVHEPFKLIENKKKKKQNTKEKQKT